jgi:quercetin dioxygenase-like cupin family protein
MDGAPAVAHRLIEQSSTTDGSEPMITTYDPVSRVRMGFEPEGENLIVDVWLEPGGRLPAHLHPRQEERWWAVDGTVCFRHGETERLVDPDDGEIVVAPGTVHGVASWSDGGAHLRCRVIPALRLQEFLEESARAGHEGLFTAQGLPRGLRGARWVARFLKRYRDETVFVSPPQIVQRALFELLARDV